MRIETFKVRIKTGDRGNGPVKHTVNVGSTAKGRSQEFFHGASFAFLEALHSRGYYAAMHSQRVAGLAVATATVLGLSPQELIRIKTAALMHEIGRLRLPGDQPEESEPISSVQYAAIQQHPQLALDILASVAQTAEDARILKIIFTHHEQPDGCGYPQGRTFGELPLDCWVLQPAIVFDAVVSREPTCVPPFTYTHAVEEVARVRDTQLHPLTTDALITAIEEGVVVESNRALIYPCERFI